MPFFQTLLANRKRLGLVIPLMRHAKVPVALKVATGAIALLILSPLDIFSDIPVLGLLDDAVLLSVLCLVFVALAERLAEATRSSSRSTALAYVRRYPTNP